LTGRRLSIPTFVALGGLLAAMLASRPQVTDPDFWWHLRNGNTLLRTGRLIAVNPYAFVSAHHHWVMQEWLSEVWMAAAAAAGGRPAVVAGYWVITLLMWVAVWMRARVIAPVSGLTVGVGLLFAALTAYPILGPRPQMATYCLLAFALLLAELQLRRGGRWAFLLGPLFLLWTDLEAGFIIGLIFLAAILTVEVGAALGGRRTPEDGARIRLLAGGTALALGASLINPNGAAIVPYPFQTQFSSAQQALIVEWQSPDFHNPLLLPLLLFVLSLLYLVVRHGRLPVRDLVLLGLALLVTLQSVRNLVILVVAATPWWIAIADQLRQRLARRWRLRLRPTQPWPAVLLQVVCLLALAGTLGWQAALESTPALASSTYRDTFPVCAAAWLERGPSGIRIFNVYGDGGFLAYELPQDKVYIFGDAALMGSRALLGYASIVDLAPGWLQRLDASQSQLVLYQRGQPLTNALQRERGWTLVYRDPLFEALVRTRLRAQLRLPPQPTPAGWKRMGLAACA
jgi:hypothetical protein